MKRAVSFFLAFLVLMSSFMGLTVSVSADSMYIRKIVSVVYDDSTSMYGDRWAFANYAMQTFCGILNSEDKLYLTYMSDPTNVATIELSSGKIQSSVDSIRNHTSANNTPYASVTTAFEKLKKVDDSNPNTQYWLVVITDGDFNDHKGYTDDQKKRILNDTFEAYVGTDMPNGTKPQVLFFGIGDVIGPDTDEAKGIIPYKAQNASEIIATMAKISDKISGRKRLEGTDIQLINDNTVRVSSSIPLLNIAVLVHGSNASVGTAIANREDNLTINRSASIKCPDNKTLIGNGQFDDLVGGVYLLEGSDTVIGKGDYDITFNAPVKLDDLVILFEPALEMRMKISLNGNEISSYKELQETIKEDKLSVSCKMYEMGTDNEINPSLLPPGTTYEIAILEDGNVVESNADKSMTLTDYVLKPVPTEVRATVKIDGFSPITYSENFTPIDGIPRGKYTIVPEVINGIRSIKLAEIPTNTEVGIAFTVFDDGTEITDPEIIKKLKPEVTVSPDGNSGETTISPEGKIIFIPNACSGASPDAGAFDVEVTCTLGDGVTTASEKYSVIVGNYQVIATNSTDCVAKNRFFGNTAFASFYITKNDGKLGKAEVENAITVTIDDKHPELKANVEVDADGTIKVTPYSEEEHKLTFWNWWTNWAYYFGLSGEDVVVTLSHAYGTGTATVDVVEDSWVYRILNVYLPLLIELVALGFLVTWIVLIITKPKYLKSAKLYVGTIKYNPSRGTHTIRGLNTVRLEKFNKIKRGNGRLKFKKEADVVSAAGIRVQADHAGRIICKMPFPWYKGRVTPYDTEFSELKTPEEIADHVSRARSLEIEEFVTTETVEGDYERALVSANPKLAKYIVVPDNGNGVQIIDGKNVIRSGKIFIYING